MVNFFSRCLALIVLLCLPAVLAHCQHPATVELRYLRAEQMPRLRSGAGDAASIEAALRARLHYQQPKGLPPFSATDEVLLSFTIGADGQVREARVLSELEPGFGKAVLAAAAQLPRFTPGRQEGQAVAVCYTLRVGAAGPYADNPTTDRAPLALPPAWPEVEKYPRSDPRLPGNVSLRTALAQRLVYPPIGSKSRYGDAPRVALAFTVDAEGHPTDVLIESSGGLAYDRAAVTALAALPPFEPYQGMKGPTATRVQVDVNFPPRPAGYQPVISNRLPADPPVDSPTIIGEQYAEQAPAADKGGKRFLAMMVQHFVVVPEEVRQGKVDGHVIVEAVAGLSGRLYGLRIQQPLSAACDSAALTAVRRLPLLTPGQYRGQTVAVRLSLLVRFWGPNHLYEPYSAPHPAAFAGGDLEAYVRANLQVSDSLRKAPQARSVDVLVVIGGDGRVQSARLTRPSLLPIDKEALRFAQAMPPWLPARDAQNQPVTSQVPLTLRFPPLPVAGTSPPLAPAPVATEKRVVKEVIPDPVYLYVERMPALPGKEEEPVGNGVVPATGIKESKLVSELRRQLVVPAEVAQGKVDGVVQVSFTVGPSGAHYNHQIHKSLSPACDAAALAAVAKLPRFIPGQQSGRAVAVSFTVALPFFGPTHVFESYEVPQRAIFPGGKDAVYTYLSEKQRVPAVMQQEKLSGYVTGKFVVGADGRVRTPQIVRGLCTSCDAEALRLLQAMPAWAPARNAQGQAVATMEHLEIRMPSAPAGSR